MSKTTCCSAPSTVATWNCGLLLSSSLGLMLLQSSLFAMANIWQLTVCSIPTWWMIDSQQLVAGVVFPMMADWHTTTSWSSRWWLAAGTLPGFLDCHQLARWCDLTAASKRIEERWLNCLWSAASHGAWSEQRCGNMCSKIIFGGFHVFEQTRCHLIFEGKHFALFCFLSPTSRRNDWKECANSAPKWSFSWETLEKCWQHIGDFNCHEASFLQHMPQHTRKLVETCSGSDQSSPSVLNRDLVLLVRWWTLLWAKSPSLERSSFLK